MSSLVPVQQAIALLLHMLRGAANAVECTASEGAYQEMLGGKSFQLLRVWVPKHLQAFPEMSANKYVSWVRLARQNGQGKPQMITQDTPFQLACCSIRSSNTSSFVQSSLRIIEPRLGS